MSQDISRQLAAAETAWDVAVIAAVGLSNRDGEQAAWGYARQAGEIVKQLRAAVKAAA